MVISGKLKVYKNDRVPIVAAILPQEFADYYLWFAQREVWVKFFRPKTPFHLTVVSSRFDGKEAFKKAAQIADGRTIRVNILLNSIRINKIRKAKAIGLYANIQSKDSLDFRRECGMVNPKKGFGHHVTFGTTKSGTVDYWPERVTIS